MKNKNKKISIGLKRHYRHKTMQSVTKKGLAIALPLIISICAISEMSQNTDNYISSFKPVPIAKEFKRSVVADSIKPELSGVKDTKDKIRAIAIKECSNRNLGEYCINDMLAMAWTESRFNCDVVGDNGNSFGCFQIHRGYHKHITIEQARDIEFSMNWTLNRMAHYGYPVYRSASIRRHNGSLNNPKTLAYLNSVNSYIDNQ